MGDGEATGHARGSRCVDEMRSVLLFTFLISENFQ